MAATHGGSRVKHSSWKEDATSGSAQTRTSGAGSRHQHDDVQQFMVCGSLFECPVKYAPIKPLGKGAYGIVCSARNLSTNERVAIKKICAVFDSVVDAKRTLREVQLLSVLRHENVVRLLDVIPPPGRGPAGLKDVYIVYELMDSDLHQIIRSPQPLSDDHISYFVYQVLRGLKYVHSAGVLHRDLKPSNLLVNGNCDLKICDFGLARSTSAPEGEMLTEYVVTRWYRAPELLLSCCDYTGAIDVWSVGCILAELLGRKPLFPGKDYVHQLSLICGIIGSPSDAETAFVSSSKARRYLSSLPRQQRADFATLWPNAHPQALDLLHRMLVFEPHKRISVDDALRHPYLAALHDAADEPVADAPFEFDDEPNAPPPRGAGAGSGRDATDVLRAALWRQVLRFNPELA